MIIGRGGDVVASTHAAFVAPLDSRNTSRDLAVLYAPAFNSSVHSNSCLLLFVSFFATVSVSNLAIAVATALCKSLIALPSTIPIR